MNINKYILSLFLFSLVSICHIEAQIPFAITFDNPDNGHKYYIEDIQYTFQDAVTRASQPYFSDNTRYYGYPLAIESYKEFNFLISDVFPNFPMLGEIWLGAVPCDADQNQWTWMNGSTNGNPFYSTYPERCFKFCGDFSGNLNTTYPRLKFAKFSMDWKPSKLSELNFLIIEYQPMMDEITVQNADYPSKKIYLQTLNMVNFNKILINSLLVPAMETPDNINYEALLPGDYITYRGQLQIEVYNGPELKLNTTYQFNSPWISAVKKISTNLFRVYGTSLDQTQLSITPLPIPPTISISGASAQFSNYQEFNQIQSVDFTLSAQISKQYPIILSNSAFYFKHNRPAIYESTSNYFFSYLPSIYDFATVKKIVANTTLLYDTPVLALGFNSDIKNFILQQFPCDYYWTNVSVVNGDVYWNGVNYSSSSSLVGLQNGGAFYYDNIQNKIVGISASNGLVSSNNMSVILTFGLGKIQNVGTGFNHISVNGGSIDIPMISNFMRPANNVVKFLSLKTGFNGTGSLSYNNKLVQFDAPSAFGDHIVQVQIIDETNFVREFNVSLFYSVSYITEISYQNGNLTISGSSMLDPISVTGVRCSSPYFTGTDVITCVVQDVPGPYKVGLIVGGVSSSDTYDFTIPNTYSMISKIYPSYIPLDIGSNITIIGANFGTSPQFSAKGVNIPNPYKLNNTAYILKLDMPFSRDIPNLVVLQNTDMDVYQNYLETFTSVGFTMDSVIQDGYWNFTIIGNYYDLYYPNWRVTLNNQDIRTAYCYNSTHCTFKFSSTDTNGNLSIFSNTSVFSLTYQEGFKPVLLESTSSIIDVNNSITFKSLFTLSDDYQVQLSNLFFLNISSKSEFQITVNQFPNWVGNHSIRVIDNVDYQYSSKELFMIYRSPIINNVTYDNGTQQVVIDGLYLAFNDLVAFPSMNITTPIISGLTESSIYPLNNTNYFDKLIIPIPNDARSGVLTLNVSNQTTTTTTTIYLPPNIYKTTNPPAVGGAFTITGKYLNPFSFDSQPILEVYFRGESRPFKILNNRYPNVLEIIAQPGTGTGILLLKNPKYSKTIDVMYQKPTIKSVSSTYFKESGDITIIGSNFVNSNFSVQLSNSSLTKECSNPKIDLSGTRIVCKFDSDIQSSTGALFVNITVGGQTIKLEKFIYYPPKVQCNGCVNGDCNNGFCQCKFGYTGVSCSQEIISVDTKIIDAPQVKNDTINVVLGSNSKNVQFNISINSISERNPEDQIIKSYKFSEIKWILQSKSDSKFNYIGTFDNDSNLEINVETTIITNNTEYNFVGDIFPLSNNSIKYLITITNWTFSNQLNKLELEFQSKSHSVQSECGGEIKPQFDTTTNSKSSLRTMEIKQGDIIMTAFFSDRMLIDENRLFYSEVSTTNHTDENGSLYVTNTMSIPYFMNSVLLDPSFGALVIFDNESKCSVKNNWKLPVIIVCSIVGAAVISTLVVIYLKKRYRYQFKLASIKLKNISRSDKYR